MQFCLFIWPWVNKTNTHTHTNKKHFSLHFCRGQHREHVLTPLQATDQGGTITMVTASGRSFTQQIKTEDTAVQETNPATLGQLVVETLTIWVKTLAHTYYCWYLLCVHVHVHTIQCRRLVITCAMATVYCTVSVWQKGQGMPGKQFWRHVV